MRQRPYTRREFCTEACRAGSLAALGGALGSALQACGGGPSGPSNVPQIQTISGTAVSGGVSVTVDSASPLASVGAAVRVVSSLGNFLVAHTGQDTFVALTDTCTHQRCDITGLENQTYVCPCHGSQFDLSGHVLSGPASASLRQFPTQFTGGVLKISA